MGEKRKKKKKTIRSNIDEDVDLRRIEERFEREIESQRKKDQRRHAT